MDLPPKAIKEFQELYFEEYEIILNEVTAKKFAGMLLGLYRTVTSSDEDCLE